MGLLIGYLIVTGKGLPSLKTYKDHLKWLTVLHLTFGSVTFCTLLYNSLDLIPQSMTFAVVIYNRSMQAIGTCLLFLYLMSFKPQVKSTDENATDGQGDNLPAEKRKHRKRNLTFGRPSVDFHLPFTFVIIWSSGPCFTPHEVPFQQLDLTW